MNTMNINYTRPTRARRIIASTPIDSMLDAFLILQAVADSLSAVEHSAGFDLIESGRESELTRLADELDDAEEFARGCLSSEITPRSWGYAFTVDSPYHARSWIGADSYAGAVDRWLQVFSEIAHARRLQAANNVDE